MAGFRPIGNNGSAPNTYFNPGDTLITGEQIMSNATVGAATLTALQLISGILNRTGSTAGYTDTLDTAANIIYALSAGANLSVPMAQVGATWRARIINTVAFAETIAAATNSGILLASGVFVTPASSWRDLLFTVKALQAQPVRLTFNTTNGSAVATIVLPPGMVAMPIGPSPQAVNIDVNAMIVGTGVPNNTQIIGVTQGQGGIIGVTMSANATATGTASLSLLPVIQVDSLGSGTL